MKVFIACSKHFYDRVESVAKYLVGNGHEISYPDCFDEPFGEFEFKVGSEEHANWKHETMMRTKSNIVANDAILVLNFEKKGIPNYIGGATFMEIIKAWELGKKIYFYNSVPRCSFTDELFGMRPLVINGDLSLVR